LFSIIAPVRGFHAFFGRPRNLALLHSFRHLEAVMAISVVCDRSHISSLS
jgi:hypothetical protein